MKSLRHFARCGPICLQNASDPVASFFLRSFVVTLWVVGCHLASALTPVTEPAWSQILNPDAEYGELIFQTKGMTGPDFDNDSRRTLTIEIARDNETRAMGLMFRQAMGKAQGMLFLFPEEDYVGFWMKNTYLPLDLIFIRADGTVARISERATPHSEVTIESGGPVIAVLEVIAGRAHSLGIRTHSQFFHSCITPAPNEAGCEVEN